MHLSLPANSQGLLRALRQPLGAEETASSTLGPFGGRHPEPQTWAVQTRMTSEEEGPDLQIPQGPKDSHQGTNPVTRKPQAGDRRKVESTKT